MALLTFRTAQFSFGYACAFTFLDLVVVFLEYVVVVVVFELYFRLAVTVNAPAHREGSELMYLIHFLDRTVTALALYLTYGYVLRVVEVYVIRQVVDLNPLDRCRLDFTGGVAFVFFFNRIPAGVSIQLVDFFGTVYFFTFIGNQFFSTGVFVDLFVTVHTNVSRRDHSLAALLCTCVTIKTVDLVDTGVYFVGVEYRLFRHIVFLAAHIDGTVYDPVTGKR